MRSEDELIKIGLDDPEYAKLTAEERYLRRKLILAEMGRRLDHDRNRINVRMRILGGVAYCLLLAILLTIFILTL